MTVKNFKVKNGLTVGTGATIYGNGNIDVAGIITAATFKGDGSGLINVTALGTGIQINNNGSIIGIGSIINFGTNIAVSPVFAGITTITGSTNPIPGISTTGTSFFNQLQVGAAATFSGEVEVADYIRHKGDTNTAIRFPTDDTFSVVTGSLERFRVESDGDIGIGTDTPRAKLDVDGTIYSAGNIKLYDNVKVEFGDSADLKIYHNPSTSPDTNTIVSGSGQILELQTDKFRVVDFGASKDLISADDGGSATLFYDGDVRLKTTGTGVDISDTLNVAGVSTFTGNSTFDAKVGIGTDNPYYKLDVNFNNSDTALSGGNSGNWGGAGLRLENENSTVGSMSLIHFRTGNHADWHVGGKFVGSNNSDLVFLQEGVNEKLRIKNDGKVGIGTDNPSANAFLHIFGTNAHLQLRVEKEGVGSFNHGVDSTGAFLETLEDDNIPIRLYTGGSERMRVAPNGNVSIGGSVSIGGTSTFNGNVGISSALLDKDGDKGSSGQVLSSTGTQVNWINVGNISAGAASSIAITANNTTNETVYPIFTDGNSGNRGAEVDTGLTYNPSTGVLTATQFTGDVTGDVTGTTSLVTAVNNASDATCFPLFTTQATGNIAPATNTNLTFDSTNGTLSATTFVGALTGNVSGTATGLSGTPDITVDEIGTRNINVSGVTTTAAVNWGGHMLPTSNAAYDIGSAELKVRHLFLSDNSLKFVDSSDTEHPLSLDNGNLKFGKGLFLGTTIKADAASGIVTATTFKGALDGNAGTATVATNAQGLTGTPNITVGVLNASSGTVSGNLNVQGTLTYVNVDNVTSTGIGTFKKGVQIHADGLDVVGIATFGTGIGVTGNITVTGNVDGRDINADGTKLDTIATSANNYTHPNHSGEVTSTADGATVIASNIVDEDNLKISNTGSNGQFLQKQSGNTGGLTWATPTDNNTWRGIDDTPVDNETDESISSNWAFDHNAGTGNLKHVPAAGNAGEFLKHDGTWGTPSYTTNTDNDTTYSISCADGDNADEEKIRLTAGGDGSGTDDIVLEAGTGLTIARSGDKITFTNSETNTNTTYDLSVEQTGGNDDNPVLRLDPSSGTNDDITITGGTNVTVTRTSGTELTISSTDNNDYANSLAFNTGDGMLTVGRTGSLADLTVDLDGRYLTSHGLTFSTGLTNSSGTVTADAAVTTTVTMATTNATEIDSIAWNSFKALEYTIHITNGSNIQAQKLLVMCAGTAGSDHHTEYGVMYSSSLLGTFSTNTAGSTVKVKFTAANSTTTTVKFIKQVVA